MFIKAFFTFGSGLGLGRGKLKRNRGTLFMKLYPLGYRPIAKAKRLLTSLRSLISSSITDINWTCREVLHLVMINGCLY